MEDSVYDAALTRMPLGATVMPELQGRLPVRVQLQGLTEKDLLKILTGPKCSLTKQ